MAGAVRAACAAWANVATAVSCQLCHSCHMPQTVRGRGRRRPKRLQFQSQTRRGLQCLPIEWRRPPKKQHTIYSCVCVLNNVTVQLTITIIPRNNNKHTTRCIVGWKAITHVLQLPALLFTLAQHTTPPHTHPSLQHTPTHILPSPTHTPPLTHTPYFLISANVWTLFSHIFICLASHKMCVNMKHPAARTHPLAYWNLIRYVAKRNTPNAHTRTHAHTTT